MFEVSLPATLLKNELFHSYFSRILINYQNSCFLKTALSDCVFKFMIFTFVGIFIFSIFRFFCFFIEKTLHWIFWKHYFVYSCMCSTSVNLFSASWGVGETPQHFDKSNIFWENLPPFTKLENMLDVIPGIIHIILKVFIKSMSVDIKSYSVAFYFPKYINVIVFPDTIWTN